MVLVYNGHGLWFYLQPLTAKTLSKAAIYGKNTVLSPGVPFERGLRRVKDNSYLTQVACTTNDILTTAALACGNVTVRSFGTQKVALTFCEHL